MTPSVRRGISTTLDVLLGFAVVCVFPFAWLLRDGLGPSSIPTSGLAAAAKTFMSFNIGPVIVLLASFRITIGKIVSDEKSRAPASPRFQMAIISSGIAIMSIILVRLFVK